MEVTAYFWRYKAEQFEQFDSIDDAARFLAYGEDAGTLSSGDGRIVAGERVIEGHELAELVDVAWSKL